MKSDLGAVAQDRPLIELRNVCLEVPVFHPADRQLLSNPTRFLTDLYFNRTRRGIARILDDVTLSLGHGERLGVVGVNGAGKSTLLRLLAGIYVPSRGEIGIHGSVKGLWDISLGMNQEATGLENIYMRGLQMGLQLRDIRAYIPEILAFSELGDAIDKPLMTYSTGMRLRLAVTISTMIEPDVLLLDEWIGTGDAHFQDKVEKRMDSLIQRTRGLVLASHNVGLMRRLCDTGLLLDKGRVLCHGDLESVLAAYDELIRRQA